MCIRDSTHTHITNTSDISRPPPSIHEHILHAWKVPVSLISLIWKWFFRKSYCFLVSAWSLKFLFHSVYSKGNVRDRIVRKYAWVPCVYFSIVKICIYVCCIIYSYIYTFFAQSDEGTAVYALRPRRKWLHGGQLPASCPHRQAHSAGVLRLVTGQRSKGRLKTVEREMNRRKEITSCHWYFFEKWVTKCCAA